MKIEKKIIRSFRDLRIWTKGIELVKKIYKITHTFPKEEMFGLTSQLRRAAVSIPSNIAEGHIRNHQKEFKQFLFISLSSLAEVETQLIIAKELGYIENIKHEAVLSDVDILGKQVRTLISKLNPNNESQITH